MTAIRKRLIGWTGTKSKDSKKRQLVFSVETDDAMDGPEVVEACVGFAIGDPYQYGNEADASIHVTDVQSTPVTKNSNEWHVTLDFGRGDDDDGGNPLDQPTKFSRSSENRERVIERDTHGKRIGNSAGDRFDEIITVEDSRTVLTAVKNYAAFPQSWYRYENTVNRKTVQLGNETYKRRRVRLSEMSDSLEFSDVLKSDQNPNGAYYQGRFQFTFASDDWDIVMLDQGLYQSYRRWRVRYTDHSLLVRANTEIEARLISPPGILSVVRVADGREPCLESPPPDQEGKATGNPTTLPMALNGRGRQIDARREPENWLEFEGYFESVFDVFNL